MTIDKAVYQPNKNDKRILRLASSEDPLQHIELDTISTLKEQYEDAVRRGYQGSFNQWIRETNIENLTALNKGGVARQKLNEGGLGNILSRDTLISMLKYEYPSEYIKLSEGGFNKISTKEISDLLNNLDKGEKF